MSEKQVITLQDEHGEEHIVTLSQDHFQRIINGDYCLAQEYLQQEIERKNRLLAYKLAFNKKDGNLDEEQCSGPTFSANVEDEPVATETDENSSINLQRWSEKETKLLIDLYKTNFQKLSDKKFKAKSIYTEIAANFERFTPEQIESKIKNLKKSYKNVLDNNKKTGRGKITWPYFDTLHDILGTKPENRPLNVASNKLGFVSQEDSDLSDSDPPQNKKAKLDGVEQNSAGPSSRKKISKQPHWVKEFREEMANRHKEKMENQREFLNLFRGWIEMSGQKP